LYDVAFDLLMAEGGDVDPEPANADGLVIAWAVDASSPNTWYRSQRLAAEDTRYAKADAIIIASAGNQITINMRMMVRMSSIADFGPQSHNAN
jgi:hypothetical protein